MGCSEGINWIIHRIKRQMRDLHESRHVEAAKEKFSPKGQHFSPGAAFYFCFIRRKYDDFYKKLHFNTTKISILMFNI